MSFIVFLLCSSSYNRGRRRGPDRRGVDGAADGLGWVRDARMAGIPKSDSFASDSLLPPALATPVQTAA